VKGRATFSQVDAAEIRRLIREKQTADRDRQKALRDQMRRLGFYITDFADHSGFTVTDFDGLVERGVITIAESVAPPSRKPPPERRRGAVRRPATRADGQGAAPVVLLGCVKLKQDGPRPARELYRSPLWQARRAYAEAAGRRWFIVSAQHGLVLPDETLAPYDLALADLPAGERRLWGERVALALEQRLGPLDGRAFELHAGGMYARALEPALAQRGATVEVPLRRVSGVGNQLAWYTAARHAPVDAEPRRTATHAEVAAALRALDREPRPVNAAAWPGDLESLDLPGLYSWSVDPAGAADLTRGLGVRIEPTRIYAGLTGATKWPSGATGKSTLRKRVGGNHIRGRVRGSTFRLTLAAVLLDVLGLEVAGPKKLTPASEAALTAWIRDHLSVAVFPFPHAGALADLEHLVLAELDPPLNLDGMPLTPLRTRLAQLRMRIASGHPA
jgi:hypothetical protein